MHTNVLLWVIHQYIKHNDAIILTLFGKTYALINKNSLSLDI